MFNPVTPPDHLQGLDISGADLSKYNLLASMKELVEAAFTNLKEAYKRQESAVRDNVQVKTELRTKRAQLERAIQQESFELVSLHSSLSSQVQSLRYKNHQRKLSGLQEQTKEKIGVLVQKIKVLQDFLDHHTHNWQPDGDRLNQQRYPAGRTSKLTRCAHVSAHVRDQGLVEYLDKRREEDYAPK